MKLTASPLPSAGIQQDNFVSNELKASTARAAIWLGLHIQPEHFSGLDQVILPDAVMT